MSQVSLIQANQYDLAPLQKSIENLIAPWGGISHFVKKGDQVLLKPNLLTGARPGKECVTRPEIVYTVAKMVQAAGGKPFIGDSPAFGSVQGVAKASGYEQLFKELNIPIHSFHGKRYELASQEFNHLLLSKEAMDADVVINLPKLKSHVQLTVTMGVKNLFGCVPGKMKAWWHLEAGKNETRFFQMLIQTAQTIDPDLTILDGIIGHGGNGPSGGEPQYVGILGASDQVFALDRAVLAVLNISPELVPTVNMSLQMGICPDLTAIDFPGLTPQELQINDWQLPTKMIPIDFGMPRILQSTFKHLYIRFIKEPMRAYSDR